ncbi:MAG TPA: hypothetical protein VHI50_08545 [Micromonosporaceae bacterium]|nr:hypothetical protein [Micromonosporaceae bacterium]
MMLMALLGLVAAIANLAMMNRLVDRFRERAAGTDATGSEIDTVVGFIRGISIGTAVIGIIVALALIGLALGNLRGSNASRIATWVLCGIGAVCGCCGLVGVLAQNNATFGGAGDDRTAEDLGRALADASPGWWTALSGTLSIGQALGYIAVAVLLALPAANAFFRRPAVPQWQPPPPPPM